MEGIVRPWLPGDVMPSKPNQAAPSFASGVSTLSIISHGTGYTPGTYSDVPTNNITVNGYTSAGTGLVVNATVASDGTVQAVYIVDVGDGYFVGDVIGLSLTGGGFQALVTSIVGAPAPQTMSIIFGKGGSIKTSTGTYSLSAKWYMTHKRKELATKGSGDPFAPSTDFQQNTFNDAISNVTKGWGPP